MPEADAFARRLLGWFDRHGRHDLPWQHPRTAYRLWIAEVMLQQTSVTTMLPYFERFTKALPTLADLAAAPRDRVLALWSGLGYYTRAHHLHEAAAICMARHPGKLPRRLSDLAALPGIGRTTAGAILAQAFGQRHPILDGNVKRVLARWHAVNGWPGASATTRKLWDLAERHTPRLRAADYTQAIMDLGALVCTRRAPRCGECPVRRGCLAKAQGRERDLPQPRPRRVVPERDVVVVIALSGDQRILLERRPPVGVWAGLWSLPEFPARATAVAEFALRYHLHVAGKTCELAPFMHAFTHFRLCVQPVLVTVSEIPQGTRDNAEIAWASDEDLGALALPTPIRQLLASPALHTESNWPDGPATHPERSHVASGALCQARPRRGRPRLRTVAR